MRRRPAFQRMMRRTVVLTLLCLAALAAPAPAADPTPIVGGEETQRQWPFMVYLNEGRQELELSSGGYCGGSLIDATWVLTAAHCIDDPALDPLLTTIVVGRHSQSDDPGERIQAKRILVHEEYAASGTPDVALIELERAPASPVPVKIAAPGDEALYATGTMATILGWGDTSDGGEASEVLKEAQVPIVSDEQCGRAYADPGWGFTPAEMICAGYPEGGTDTCQGDSGGPLVVPVADGTWRQVGVTSFGEGCAKAGFPGVYSEAAGAKIREWVRAVVPGAIAATSSAAPAPAPQSSPPAAAPSSQPAAPARKTAAKKKRAKASRALKRCLKKAGRSKRKQRACRRKHR